MADLAPELVRRVRQLSFPEQAWARCPCGAPKLEPLTVVRRDAAQYFKNADVGRAQRAVDSLLDK
eukprot:14185547-Alexandrium_andersonii.AAC.1